jgi:integrase/recombinase XerC
LEQFAKFCIQDFSIQNAQDVTQSVVRSWTARLMEDNYESSSVHRKVAAVNAWFKYLKKMGMVEVNPARGIPKPKKPGRLPTFVDETAANNLYRITAENTAESQDTFAAMLDELIMLLLYETGMRRAELLGLKDSDVDFGLGQIKVLGKRNKMRYIPVSRQMLTRIEAYMDIRNSKNFERTSGHLLIGIKGKKITKTFVYLKVKTYLSQITTIKRKSPHVLRHTFATHMLNNGADLNVIKEILGHSSLAATQVYTHNSIEKLKSIHAKMHPRNN